MSDNLNAARQPRSLLHLNIASAGMAIVALVCVCSGLVYGSGKLFYGSGHVPSTKEVLYVLVFFLLSAPYFFYREAFVEEPDLPAFERSNNTFFALVASGFLAVIVLLLLALKGLSIDETVHLVILMVISLVPFGYIGTRSLLQLRKGGAAARSERLFKNKVLLPAFATCLVSFSLGWAVANPESAYICVVLPAFLIVLLKEMAVRNPQLQVSVIIAILLCALLGCLFLYRLRGYLFAKVLIIGIILTFAMGVAEVCKRVVMYHGNVQRNSIESYDFYYAGSNWSSIVFPLLVCFLPLLIDDLPVLPIFVLLSLQYLHWNHWTSTRSSLFLRIFNVLLGLLLPVFVCFQYLFSVNPVGFGIDLLDRLFGFTVATMTIIGLVATFFVGDVGKFFRSAMVLKLDVYSDHENCFFLFLFVMLCTLLGVYLYAALAAPLFSQPLIAAKATETIVYLLILLALSIGMYWYNNLDVIRSKFRSSSSINSGIQGDDGAAKTERKVWTQCLVLLLQVGRLPVGVIASVPVTLLILLHSNVGWPWAVFHGLPICAITMAGFAFNDIFDLAKDRAAGARKPLAVGLVSVRGVRVFAWSLAVFGLSSAVAIIHGNSVFIIAMTLAGVSSYSWLAQKAPVFKGIATAILCCAPFAYGAAIANVHFPMIFYVFLLVFISGRELLLDVKDFVGDQKAGIDTLVAYLRPPASRVLGWLLMGASVAVVVGRVDGVGRLFFLITFGSLGACLLIYVRDERKGLAWSRITLLCGVLGAAFSV
jgi:4-hydroxybenzoate polyprenyltransferase